MKLPQYGAPLEAGRVVSSGTLRTQDLLRAFADEYERMMPFNGKRLVREARAAITNLEEADPHRIVAESALFTLDELHNELIIIAAAHNLAFGTEEGDGACFGFWTTDDD